MSKISHIYIILLFLTTFFNLYAQERRDGRGIISGFVIDSVSGSPIEYANIVVLSFNDTTVVTGTVSDTNGNFIVDNVPFGKYYLELRFIGYKNKARIIVLNSDNSNINIGTVRLSSGTINLNDVVIEGTRNPISYQIDKKVIDVGKMETTVSGNAADVLENIPSVTVDIEGNVSLRGSTNFTVLVDGKPSVMDPQDILQQIPATSIQSIEIITNPSAKYDPEGTAGIINIILKKQQTYGLSGIVNGNAGLDEKYGGDFLFEYKTPGLNYNFGLNYNRRIFPGTSMQRNIYSLPGDKTYLNNTGTMEWGRNSYGLRGGLEFDLTQNDLLSFSGRYGNGRFERNSSLNYQQWSDADPRKDFYVNEINGTRDGQYFAISSNYSHKFQKKDHQITTELFYSHHNSDESSVTTTLTGGVKTGGTNATESGPENEFRGKLDYTLPLGEKNKFETGYQGEIELSKDNNGLYTFDSISGALIFQPLYSHSNKYNNTNQAFYSIYSDEFGNFGLQGGLRAEYTYQTTDITDNNQYFKIDRWDYFPSVHSSFKFGTGSQIMASYTRRIDRPHGWFLEPYITWEDANNVRKGNPALEPEFIDSYDAGLQTFITKVNFSADFYYRITQNKIENIRSTYQNAENVTLTTFDNVGKDYSLGGEFMVIYDPASFWDINLMSDIYNYRIRGKILNETFDRNSFNWSIRMNNEFKILQSTSLQLNVRYNSPTVSSQGREEGFFSTDASLKQNLFGKQISLILQIRDLFISDKHEFTSVSPDLYSYQNFNRKTPIVMLNVRFNFNDYKEKRNEQPDSGIEQQPEEY